MKFPLPLALACLAFAAVNPAHGGPFTIVPTFDSSITNDPNAAAIEGTINTAIGIYEHGFSNSITVTIYFQELNSGTDLGTSDRNLYIVPYSTFYTALATQPSDASRASALASLPNQPNNPVNGGANLDISTANIKALGLGGSLPPNSGITASGGNYDGVISIRTGVTIPGSPGSSLEYYLMPVVEHEIDEILGFGSSLNQSFETRPSPEDLYRYASAGVRSYTTNSSATAFFSINGGTSLLAQFDNQNDGGDWGDWRSNPLPNGTSPRVQDAFATPGADPALGVELTALDVIGYDATTPEPGSLTLLGLAIAGLTAYRRRHPTQSH